jgi:type III restriction enzyme
LEKAESEESADVSEENASEESDGNGELTERKLTKEPQGELLRKMVDTIGVSGQPGEQIQNVISVGMLSEGWDAKTVTHIMGLRAFSSQLLCEQVVGRGLRRTSYDVGENGLFAPEYVNIFGIPFTFLPHEGGDGPPPPPPTARTRIEPINDKVQHKISFPNVRRIDRVYRPNLSLDWNNVKVLMLDPTESITQAELAGMLEGKPNPQALSEIEIVNLAEKYRTQTLIFNIAAGIYHSEKKPDWKGSKESFLIQLIHIVEQFIASNKLKIKDSLFDRDERRRRILIMLNIGKVIHHLWKEVKAENTEVWIPVFDKDHPIRSTSDIRTWWTSRGCNWFEKSHINFTVFDSTLEYDEAKKINGCRQVESFVKNDHLGFAVYYTYQGVIRRYIPDYLIRLKSGTMLVLEVKGRDTEQDRTKREFLADWCAAVNQDGRFGRWFARVSFDANDLSEILSDSQY